MIKRRYDYIILGAGTSGCYLAHVLSQDKANKVLVVEAGALSKNPVFTMPAGFTQTLFDKNYNWCFNSQPEAQLANRSIYCPRGKVVGGSSMINGMIHSIGQVEDYQDWQASGFDLVEPQAVMAKFQELFPNGDELTKAESHVLESAFLNACEQMGLPGVDKLHEHQSEHVAGTYYHTVASGRRASARSLLPDLKQRPNVTFLTDTVIDQLVFKQGKVHTIKACKGNKKPFDIAVKGKVILSLGAIGTPALLQRSGVGRVDDLSPLNIQQVQDLPVGENLQDHLLVKRTYKLNNVRTYNRDAAGLSITKTLWDYSVNRKGAMTAGASSTGAFLSVDDNERPDTQVFFSYGSATDNGKALIADSFDAITIGTYQLRPESRGKVAITSQDPFSSPSICYNYLASDTDWHVTREGLKYQERLMAQPAFTTYEPEALVTDTDHDDYIRDYAETAHHPVGTCSVGENGVVDGDLSVYGIDNLSIADASIIPSIISGNTQAICAVIGNVLGEAMLARSNHV